jgi:hypothetical protein
MNRTNVIEYIKFAYWAVKSNQSIQDCFKLDESVEAITDHVNSIINDSALNEELCNIIPLIKINENTKKKKPLSKNLNECIIKNMQVYDTTNDEAHKYETQCHNCGDNINIGQKYCSKGCSKFIEDYNYDCFWGKSCKMCHVHREYFVMTRNFEFSGKTYWIDDQKNVYNNENEKVAMERDGNIIYT